MLEYNRIFSIVVVERRKPVFSFKGSQKLMLRIKDHLGFPALNIMYCNHLLDVICVHTKLILSKRK